MRHVNRRRGKNSWWGDPDKILTEPHEQDYVKSYKNNGFKNASSKNTYVKFLRYIADNPGSTRKEILDGLGRLKGAADGGRGQNSSLFAQLLYLDLIDYDDKFKYFITDKGEKVLETAKKNDENDAGPDSAMESTRKTKMKWKLYNEVRGWDLEDEDLTLVNSESDGDKLYIVKLWWGAGYMLDCYNAYAFSDEEALNYVVAYIEKTDPKSLETIDENANDYLQELVDEGEAASIEEAYEHPYFQETYLWVDATMEGAEQGHYIYNENLQIAEYPKEHNYPMSKGIKRGSRRVKESTRRARRSARRFNESDLMND